MARAGAIIIQVPHAGVVATFNNTIYQFNLNSVRLVLAGQLFIQLIYVVQGGSEAINRPYHRNMFAHLPLQWWGNPKIV